MFAAQPESAEEISTAPPKPKKKKVKKETQPAHDPPQSADPVAAKPGFDLPPVMKHRGGAFDPLGFGN